MSNILAISHQYPRHQQCHQSSTHDGRHRHHLCNRRRRHHRHRRCAHDHHQSSHPPSSLQPQSPAPLPCPLENCALSFRSAGPATLQMRPCCGAPPAAARKASASCSGWSRSCGAPATCPLHHAPCKRMCISVADSSLTPSLQLPPQSRRRRQPAQALALALAPLAPAARQERHQRRRQGGPRSIRGRQEEDTWQGKDVRTQGTIAFHPVRFTRTAVFAYLDGTS